MKRVIYKRFRQCHQWKSTDSLKVIEREISKLTPGDVLEIEIDCPHKNTWVDQGIKICKECGAHLEVTSWRD